MVEQSTNDLNQLRDQIHEVENQNAIADRKIAELDTGNQNLLEKLLGLENVIGDKVNILDQRDESLKTRIEGLEADNSQKLSVLQQDVEKKLSEQDNQYHNQQDAIRNELNITINEYAQQMNSQKDAIEKRISQMDTGNQQLLGKILDVEQDFDGKLKDNTDKLGIMFDTLENENKDHAQKLVGLQEAIYIQTEQVKKVDAERQQASVKAENDVKITAENNAKYIDSIKEELLVERQRVDNNESQLRNLDELLQKTQPEITRNIDRLDDLDSRHMNQSNKLDDVSK